MFPDFLVIGAQKAGTTWLRHNLQAHPQIWMPPVKEIHYFDEKITLEGGLWSRLRGGWTPDARWRRQIKLQLMESLWRYLPPDARVLLAYLLGIDPGHILGNQSLSDFTWALRYFFRGPSDEWYASLFERGRNRVTGEITPDYSILDKGVIARIYDLMPEAKIIFFMRNPIERLWSATEMRHRSRGGTIEGVEDSRLYRQLGWERARLMTDYQRTLENWGSFYSRRQIFTGFLEDIHFVPEQLLEALYGFLGVDTSIKSAHARCMIHSGLQSTMPTRFAVYLARSYRGELEELADCFGGYASFWLYCAERLVDEPPPEEHVPYPFWRSTMWEEWKGSRGLAMRSGPLSSIQPSL